MFDCESPGTIEEEDEFVPAKPPEDCTLLISCDWPGIDLTRLGNGICNRGVQCHDSAICQFDDGDCPMPEMPPSDCSLLSSCDWPGIDTSHLGDGNCDTISCHNSKACNCDGGDCEALINLSVCHSKSGVLMQLALDKCKFALTQERAMQICTDPKWASASRALIQCRLVLSQHKMCRVSAGLHSVNELHK